MIDIRSWEQNNYSFDRDYFLFKIQGSMFVFNVISLKISFPFYSIPHVCEARQLLLVLLTSVLVLCWCYFYLIRKEQCCSGILKCLQNVWLQRGMIYRIYRIQTLIVFLTTFSTTFVLSFFFKFWCSFSRFSSTFTY